MKELTVELKKFANGSIAMTAALLEGITDYRYRVYGPVGEVVQEIDRIKAPTGIFKMKSGNYTGLVFGLNDKGEEVAIGRTGPFEINPNDFWGKVHDDPIGYIIVVALIVVGVLWILNRVGVI